jgi:prepilin-type N-terminal cleavage/methylation domain-containing protein
MISGSQVTHSFHHFKKQRAFSLLELLAVTAIVGMLMALAVPAISGFTSPAGRKGAVIVVMNALEQARVSAIETGRDVAVLFWRKNGSTGTLPDEPDALMLLRRNETDTAWEPATRWIKLPNGVLFHSEDENSLIRGSQPDSSLLSAVPGATPSASQTGALQFSSSGAVKNPATSSAGLYIAFTEGQRASGSNTLAVDKQKSGGREVISLARYTGRATMDIVATP